VDSGSGVEQRLDGLGAAIGGGSPRAVPIAATVVYSTVALSTDTRVDTRSPQCPEWENIQEKGPHSKFEALFAPLAREQARWPAPSAPRPDGAHVWWL
jgi:hypothetical protein